MYLRLPQTKPTNTLSTKYRFLLALLLTLLAICTQLVLG